MMRNVHSLYPCSLRYGVHVHIKNYRDKCIDHQSIVKYSDETRGREHFTS